MKNITITLDQETASWARLEAARREMSVSKLLRSLLQEHMMRSEAYEAAMLRYLAAAPRRLKKKGTYPSREELHHRADLR